MYRGNRSRFFPILVVIIIAAIIIFGLVSLVRVMTHSGTKSPDAAVSLTSQLLNTENDRSVSMVGRGPIVGDENFNSYEITVSPTNRTITTWQGYDHNKTIATETLGNNTKAYDQFVNALNYAGYTKSAIMLSNDTHGLCANGRVYDFVLASGASSLDDRWTTNCGIKGSFRGSAPAVRLLFLAQMPDAPKLVNDINM